MLTSCLLLPLAFDRESKMTEGVGLASGLNCRPLSLNTAGSTPTISLNLGFPVNWEATERAWEIPPSLPRKACLKVPTLYFQHEFIAFSCNSLHSIVAARVDQAL